MCSPNEAFLGLKKCYKIEGSENLEELSSIQNRVEELRLQDKLGNQNFREDIRKLYEPLTNTSEDTSRVITKTMMEIPIKNIKTVGNSNNKVWEIMNVRDITAFFRWHLSKVIRLEVASQYKVVKDPTSNRLNVLLKNKTKPVFLYNKLSTSRDTDEQFELQGDLLKLITNLYYVELAKISDKKQLWILQ